MNALSKSRPVPEPFGAPLPDGSLVITPDQLARFGAGDAKRGMRELQLILAAEKDPVLRTGPSVKPKNVRVATIADEKAIFDLLMEDLKENAETIAPINPDRVAQHLFACTRKKAGHCGLIDGPDGKPIAIVMLFPMKWWWSEQWYYREGVCYVHPDHRKSNHAADLLSYSRWWVDNFTTSFGYRTYLVCGVMGLKRVREKAIFYRRRFMQVGWEFMYPPAPSVESDR